MPILHLLSIFCVLIALPALAQESPINGDLDAPMAEAGSVGIRSDEIPPALDVPPPPPRDVFHDAACDFEAWVGKPLDEEAIKVLGRPYRILKPGDMMTEDYSPSRINVEHTNGIVTRVWCG